MHNQIRTLQSGVITSLLMVFIMVTSACSHLNLKKENVDLEELALNAFRAEDFVSSRAYYEQVLQYKPTISAYVGLAESLEELGEWPHASEVWLAVSRIETLPPSLQGSYITNASKSLLRSNDPNGADKLMKTLTNEQSNQRAAQSVSGLISVFKGNKASAISHFRKILDKIPNDQSTLTNLGLSYLVFDEPSKAIEILEKLSDDAPSKLNHAIAPLCIVGKKMMH